MSRLFAACFMCASRLSGSLMLMDVVLGFRLGKITRCALLQSTISAESVFSQYSRSSCSDFKLGALFFIDLSFFPRHGPRRNDTNFCIVSSKRRGPEGVSRLFMTFRSAESAEIVVQESTSATLAG